MRRSAVDLEPEPARPADGVALRDRRCAAAAARRSRAASRRDWRTPSRCPGPRSPRRAWGRRSAPRRRAVAGGGRRPGSRAQTYAIARCAVVAVARASGRRAARRAGRHRRRRAGSRAAPTPCRPTAAATRSRRRGRSRRGPASPRGRRGRPRPRGVAAHWPAASRCRRARRTGMMPACISSVSASPACAQRAHDVRGAERRDGRRTASRRSA